MGKTYEDTVISASEHGGAVIASVLPETPADDAGFTEGCRILRVDGCELRDILDWQWLSSDVAMTLDYIDAEGDAGSIELERDVEEAWGFNFADCIFDDVRICKNNCTFCFMTQLPRGMRKSLYLRDDDYRLSFLDGTFVTLTNMEQADIDRIIEQHLSPLRLSLHAYTPHVREQLMGKHQDVGIQAFEQLAHAGIHFDVQIVLVPGVNDGEELDRTLSYLYGFKEVDGVGIVPLGFTSHQARFSRSCTDAQSASKLIAQVGIYQEQARNAGRGTWVWPADEFYLGVADGRLDNMELENLVPDASYYECFEMYEDGIGMIRTTIDEWMTEDAQEARARCAEALERRDAHVLWICGEAIAPVFKKLLSGTLLERRMEVLPVLNGYFGGNVNVTGLLCGCDIAQAVNRYRETYTGSKKLLAMVPDIVFNSDGVTLDDMDTVQMSKACGCSVCVVSCQVLEMLEKLSVSA